MFDEIDDKQMEIFEKVATKLALRSELSKIKDEIETLIVKEDIENANYSEEIKNLTLRKETLQGELEDEENLTSDPEILQIRIDVKNIEQRLKKLEEKKDTISETVYTRLKTEYTELMQKAQEKLTQEETKYRDWHAQAKALLEKAEDLKEEISIRGSIGDLSKEKMNEELKKLKINNKKSKIVFSVTQLLIDGEIDVV